MLCNPCLYNYDFILKMETFDRDSGALLRKVRFLKIYIKLTIYIKHLNKNSGLSIFVTTVLT